MDNLNPYEALTGYHQKLIEIGCWLVENGFGEAKIDVRSLKDNTIQITIISGRSYTYFVKKDFILESGVI